MEKTRLAIESGEKIKNVLSVFDEYMKDTFDRHENYPTYMKDFITILFFKVLVKTIEIFMEYYFKKETGSL